MIRSGKQIQNSNLKIREFEMEGIKIAIFKDSYFINTLWLEYRNSYFLF